MNRISPVFKVTYETNPDSGHSWAVHGPTTGYEVVGNRHLASQFKTYKKALAEKNRRDDFDRKYPFKWLTTERERKACEYLGLTLKTGPTI
jgi:hypothetical protein